MNEKKKIARKTVILYVLNIIKRFSSAEHPVTQSVICNYLNEIGVACDRKTVGRNIEYLKDFGYPIVKVIGKGFYLDRNEMEKTNKMWVI